MRRHFVCLVAVIDRCSGQFTSHEVTQRLKDNKISISMDGRAAGVKTCLSSGSGRASNTRRCNVKTDNSVSDAKAHLGAYLNFLNTAGLSNCLTARRPIRSTTPVCRTRASRHDVRVPHRPLSSRLINQ